MMKSAWKSLYPRISTQLSRTGLSQVRPWEQQISIFVQPLVTIRVARNLERRYFSSEAAIEREDRDLAFVADIFSKRIDSHEIQAEFESRNVYLDRETVYLALQNLEGNLETARRFFDWVSDRDSQILRSKSYNMMLRIVGINGESGEFWDFVETMKKKGFGISKDTYLKIHESLVNDGKGDDFGTHLKEVYLQNTDQHIVARMCPKICRILNEKADSEEIQKKLLHLDISLSSELIVSVLESVGSNPQKALIFLEWVRDIQYFKIDGTVYNAFAKVFGREDCIKEFWDVLHKMRNAGYKLEHDVYFTVLDRFQKRKMVAAAIDLYEFAMAGPGKPPAGDFLHLLKKIVVSKDLDMTLITRIVTIFIKSGNTINASTFVGALKSLKSVGRLGECGNVLKAMEEGGFVADSSIHNQVVVGLCGAGKLDAACEHVRSLENLGLFPNLKAWAFLVQNHALAGELDKAVSYFHEMVETNGCGHDDGSAFEVLVSGLFKKNRNMDAFRILKEMVMKKKYRPQHSTYKLLIEKLVNQGSLKEAMSLLELMKGQGFPPFVEPFMVHMSKSGSVSDAMGFLKAMTVKQFPSVAVFLRLFRALLEAGRHEVAHDILSKSPGCVRNHVDILDIFSSLKPNNGTALA
ncbi:pentatricopeptide repeat-containing protein At5g15980, mitochondrial-like [Phalaenopsis equestris]|uniref:pentatricopeptide repeat-containing protein At5g15980, mitochondrial-like n=1 Tax=Phalaenopsis equestris TaxID=78828 RepID=UPI0009E20E4A|nr:pentatricopeptide repeat-containing protein At5g15980, mitochondrial-like [Phalaenopsis equestris]